ncbi:hypothetical protein [Pasteurella canis]|uniref:hypothetical protein n=1 Tax=Pasteurella canis TaxID=753 RepID=UPI001328238C|nr:hypothetical protein [Pasteurella canis]MXN88527.1 hypothetical protein [Pasteurella canis]
MWKKIAMSCIVIILAILLALYWQINHVKTIFAQSLNNSHISFNQLSLNFYPQPYFELTNVKWYGQKERSIFAEKINLELDVTALLNPQKSLKQFTFQQAQFWYSGQVEPDLKNVNGEIIGEFFIDEKQIRFANTHLKMTFEHPILFNTKQLQISVQKGVIQQLSETEFKVVLDYCKINGEDFTFVNATFSKSKESSLFSSQVAYLDNHPELQVSFSIKNLGENQQAVFTGKNIALASWQNVLSLPQLFTGYMDASGEVILQNNKVQSGHIEMDIPEGQFKGINLLALVARYLPINYDEQRLKEKALTTSFQNLRSRFSWDTRQLLLKQFTFISDKLAVEGKGDINLTNMQCEIVLNLGLTYPQYQQFKLPIRFFDHCYSPQYKVEFNQHLRHQLKDLLKEKFK